MTAIQGVGYARALFSGSIVRTNDSFYGVAMNKTLTNQVIALSGLAQTVYLIQQVARKGAADQDAVRVLISSVLKIDADDVLDVYGGISGLREGLKQLVRQLLQYLAGIEFIHLLVLGALHSNGTFCSNRC